MDNTAQHSLHIYSGTRRPEASVRRSQALADEAKGWTAARCHRLLRALTSRVAILTKDLARFQQQDGVTTNNKLRPKEKLRGKGQLGDEDWLKTKQRVTRTYSTKGRKAATHGSGEGRPRGRKSINPGEVLVPTPILARVRGEHLMTTITTVQHTETCQPAAKVKPAKVKRRRTFYGEGSADEKFQLSGTLWDIRRATALNRFSTYEGIYNGLETLLHATSPTPRVAKVKGARSLLSMALRAVPRYMNEQEAMLQNHMEQTGSKLAVGNRDIAVETYDDLEAYGSTGYGWKQLKVIVRAHGVQVLSDAIVLGVLEVQFCGVLISLCTNMGAVEEAELLLSALLLSTSILPPRTLNDKIVLPMKMLQNFTLHTGRSSFQLKTMSRLIVDHQLPLEWLATKDFSEFWTGVLQKLTPDDFDSEALECMEILLLRLSTYSATDCSSSNAIIEAVQNTYFSLLTTLSSIILLRKETGKEKNVSSPPEGIQQLTALLTTCLRQNADRNRSNSQYVLLLVANIIIEDEVKNGHQNASLLCEVLDSSKNQYHSTCSAQASMLICQIARCCGRGTSELGFQHLQQIHLRLEVLACGQGSPNVLKTLIVDSAFAFARKVPDRQHIDYAAGMDATYYSQSEQVNGSLTDMADSDAEDNNSGFRWEEGIGEWVTATPGTNGIQRAAIVDMESDDDSPFRPPPKIRGMVGNTPLTIANSFEFSDGIDELDESSQNLSRLSSSPADRYIIDNVSSSEQDYKSPGPLNFEEPDDHESLLSASSISGSREGSSKGRWPSQTEQSPTGTDSTDVSDEDESEADELNGDLEMPYGEDSIGSWASPQYIPASTPSPPLSTRRIISRTPRLTRKLFHSQQRLSQTSRPSSNSAASLFGTTSTRTLSDQRELIDRAPRLGRRALHSSQTWQVFDDSDDELSFLSVSSAAPSLASCRNQALREITKNIVSKKQARRVECKQEPSGTTRKRAAAQMSESEDELCI